MARAMGRLTLLENALERKSPCSLQVSPSTELHLASFHFSPLPFRSVRVVDGAKHHDAHLFVNTETETEQEQELLSSTHCPSLISSLISVVNLRSDRCFGFYIDQKSVLRINKEASLRHVVTRNHNTAYFNGTLSIVVPV